MYICMYNIQMPNPGRNLYIHIHMYVCICIHSWIRLCMKLEWGIYIHNINAYIHTYPIARPHDKADTIHICKRV